MKFSGKPITVKTYKISVCMSSEVSKFWVDVVELNIIFYKLNESVSLSQKEKFINPSLCELLSH